MTNEQRIKMAKGFEKGHFSSKKFVAFLLMEFLLCGMAITALITQKDLGWPLAAFMTGVVVTMGSIAMVFNGYQAKLDMYVRGMALTGEAPRSLMEKLFGANPKGTGGGTLEDEEEEI